MIRLLALSRSDLCSGAALVLVCVGGVLRADAPTTRPVSELAKPTLITMSASNASIKSVLDAMQKQSRIRVTTLGEPEGATLNVDFKDTPWLEAVMRVAQAAKLNPAILNGDRWVLAPSGTRVAVGPRDVQGPAMVALNSVFVERKLPYGQTQRVTRQLRLACKLMVEPSIEAVGVSAVSEATITDTLGREFPAGLWGVSRGVRNAGLSFDFTVVADLPDSNAERVASVRGTLIAPVIVERQTLAIPDVLASAGKQFAFAGGQVTIDAVRPQDGRLYEVDLTFDRGTLPRYAMAHVRYTSSLAQPVQTNKAHPCGIGMRRLSELDGVSKVTLAVEFKPVAGRDADAAMPRLDLSWNLPVTYGDVSVPFKIQDIQLP